jgi:hypothetical protein
MGWVAKFRIAAKARWGAPASGGGEDFKLLGDGWIRIGGIPRLLFRIIWIILFPPSVVLVLARVLVD